MHAPSTSPALGHRLPHRRACGFTMVETLIAMFLGLLVIGALGQIYVGGRVVNRVITGSAAQNESGRFAMDIFARDIRLAGYFSCGGAKADLANALNDETFWTRLRGLEGFDGGDDTRGPESLPSVFDALPAPLPGRDVVVVRYADMRKRMLVTTGDFDPPNSRFLFDTDHPFQRGNVLLLNDAACGQTAAFQVMDAANGDGNHSISYDPDATTASPGNCTNKLAGGYDCTNLSSAADPSDGFVNATLAPMTVRTFFVADQPADDCTPSAENCPAIANCPTLYAAGTDVPDAIPVLPDVTDLEITYGIDDQFNEGEPASGDAEVDRYLDAHAIRASDLWHRVISVRLRLELTNADCQPVGFETTVALRNFSTNTLRVY